MIQLERSVSIATAARIAGVTYSAVRQAVLEGRVKGGRDALGRLLADRRDVERWAAARAARGTRRQPKPA
jgi:hypothetical protein